MALLVSSLLLSLTIIFGLGRHQNTSAALATKSLSFFQYC